jgi:hypothetical protein
MSKILRKSYKTKSGKVVKSKYIKKTGLLSGKSSQRTKQLLNASKKRSMKASKLTRSKSKVRCPKGKILRSAYLRKGYTSKNGYKVKSSVVAADCIKDVGLPGKQKKLIVLDPEDHFLSEHGYSNIANLKVEQRKSALMSLIKHFIPIKGEMATMTYVIRALNARYILNRNTNPKVANIFKTDRNMISKMYKKMKK